MSTYLYQSCDVTHLAVSYIDYPMTLPMLKSLK